MKRAVIINAELLARVKDQHLRHRILKQIRAHLKHSQHLHHIPSMHLRHLHLPGLTRYAHAATLQETLVRAFLSHKADPSSHPAIPPTLLTFQFHPVYTCGRRELNTLSRDQIAYLRSSPAHTSPADFEYAARGGQTTFHGPGQLVAYPILDLRRHGLSSRCYVHALEETVITTCGYYGVSGFRTENPGVWTSEDEKICAVGVHLRRYVSSHGIGLNVTPEPLEWLKRIVACGLEGKRATALELVREEAVAGGVESVAEVFARQLAEKLDGVEAVQKIEEKDLDERNAS